MKDNNNNSGGAEGRREERQKCDSQVTKRQDREKVRRERWTETMKAAWRSAGGDRLSTESCYGGICALACNVGGIMTEYGIEIKLTGQRRKRNMRNCVHFLKKLHF